MGDKRRDEALPSSFPGCFASSEVFQEERRLEELLQLTRFGLCKWPWPLSCPLPSLEGAAELGLGYQHFTWVSFRTGNGINKAGKMQWH